MLGEAGGESEVSLLALAAFKGGAAAGAEVSDVGGLLRARESD